MTIFDPAFTPGDASYLRDHAGYAVLSVRTELNETSVILHLELILMFVFQAEPENYATSPDTVVYMPHCELSLFERFLNDNWSRERVPNLVLVGNTLSDYADK